MREAWLQDVFDCDNVVMLEVFEDFQFSQRALGVCQNLKGIGNLLNCNLLT